MTHHLATHYLDTPKDIEEFLSDLELQFAECNKQATFGHLVIIRVNNIPMIMSAYDNKAADKTIHTLQDELKKYFTHTDKIYRISYNQLALIINGDTIEDIQRYADFIFKQAQNIGNIIDEFPVHVTVSMGSVSFPDVATCPPEAINFAFIALTNTKSSALNYFSPYSATKAERHHAKNQMILAKYIQTAMQEKRLCLAYQPIIDSTSGKAVSYECLLRIKDEKGKIISAGSFIPIAEKLGFIDTIDKEVLLMVVKELETYENIHFSINVSNVTINNAEWIKLAKSYLKNPKLASRLTVEITETAIQYDFNKLLEFITILHDLGCKIALDDFGAGYTSFKQLKSLPIDIVKIDGYYVKDIVDSSDNRLFVKTLLDFAKAFGLKTVAEYVENSQIADLLKDFKVDYMQGNFFCPAVNYQCWEDK